MLVDERQAFVLDRINKAGQVSSSALSAEFGISEDTIRRDLRDLSARGFCRRVYGGALRVSPASGSSTVRAEQDVGRKRALGAALAGLVRPGQFVFIDAGTTNRAAARALPTGLGLTVATHDPSIAAALSGREDLDLIVVGGRVDPLVGAATGGDAARAIGLMRPDLLLLGACALDPDRGFAVFDGEDACINRLLIEQSGSVAAALLSDKLGTSAPFSVGPAAIAADLVMERDAAAPILDRLAAAGLRLHRCAGTAGEE